MSDFRKAKDKIFAMFDREDAAAARRREARLDNPVRREKAAVLAAHSRLLNGYASAADIALVSELGGAYGLVRLDGDA